MGYSTRPDTKIQDYWPDDTENEIYICADGMPSLNEIQDRIQDKWPGAAADNIRIEAAHIQTQCIGYDLYDSQDYTNFIIIRRLPGA